VSVAALAAFVAALLAVAGTGATVRSGACAILGRGRAIVGGGLALGPGRLGLVRVQRVAERGVDVSLSGSLVSGLCGTISGVGRAIGLVAVVLRGHRTQA
jgi:hypothetical protein